MMIAPIRPSPCSTACSVRTVLAVWDEDTLDHIHLVRGCIDVLVGEGRGGRGEEGDGDKERVKEKRI